MIVLGSAYVSGSVAERVYCRCSCNILPHAEMDAQYDESTTGQAHIPLDECIHVQGAHLVTASTYQITRWCFRIVVGHR